MNVPFTGLHVPCPVSRTTDICCSCSCSLALCVLVNNNNNSLWDFPKLKCIHRTWCLQQKGTLELTEKLLTDSIFSNLEYKVFCHLYRLQRTSLHDDSDLKCSRKSALQLSGIWSASRSEWLTTRSSSSVSSLIMCNSCNLHVPCLIIQRSWPNSCYFACLSDHFFLDENRNASLSLSFLVPLPLIVLCFCNLCEKSERGMMMRQIHRPLVEWMSSLFTLKHPVGYYTQNMKQNEASDCRPCQSFGKACIKRVELCLISSLSWCLSFRYSNPRIGFTFPSVLPNNLLKAQAVH